MLDTLNKESFEPLLADSFLLRLSGGSLQLQLVSVQGNGLRGGRREQFSLHFRGPVEPLLPQATYGLEHAGLGRLDIFLVPIGSNGDGVTYEAVFT